MAWVAQVAWESRHVQALALAAPASRERVAPIFLCPPRRAVSRPRVCRPEDGQRKIGEWPALIVRLKSSPTGIKLVILCVLDPSAGDQNLRSGWLQLLFLLVDDATVKNIFASMPSYQSELICGSPDRVGGG